MRVKGVVEELSQEDLLLAVKSGSSHVVEALCTKYHLTNGVIVEIIKFLQIPFKF
jgi:phosphoribosylformylglycinamidine (FGAM) synthase-like enzyme